MINILFSVCIICLTLIFSGQVFAAEINQIIELVIRNNPTYQQAESRYRASTYQLESAQAPSLPQVSLNSNHQYISDSSQEERYNATNASVRISQSLFNRSIDSASQLAEIQIEIARIGKDQALQTLLKELAELYFDYTDVNEQVELVSAEMDKFENLMAVEQEKYDAQTSSIIDLSRVKADLFQAKSRLLTQQNLLAVASDKLITFLGVRAELPALHKSDDLRLTTPEGTEQSWVDTAMDNNPGISLANLSIENAEEQMRSAQSSTNPNLSVFGSYTWNRNDMENNERSSNQSAIGIELSWTLYDGGGSSSRTSQFREDYRSAQLELENQQKNTADLVRYYWRTLKSQFAVIKANTNSAEAARLSYQATELSFDAGTVLYSDLLESQNRYFTSERTLRASRYQFMRNYIQLYYNAGLLNKENFVAVTSQWIDS